MPVREEIKFIRNERNKTEERKMGRRLKFEGKEERKMGESFSWEGEKNLTRVV